MVMKRATVEGISIHYWVGGTGRPVVLVHGLSGSALWWRHMVPALIRRYQVYLIDLPGYGSLRQHRPHVSLSSSSSWLQAWIDALGLPPVRLIGHSMGGYICARVAAQAPATVHSLVLIAPVGVPSEQPLWRYLFPLALAVRSLPPRFLPVLAYDALRAGPAMLLRGAWDVLVQDIRVDLGCIAAPTLLLWGGRDTLISPMNGRLMAQNIPHAHVVLFGESGHVPMYDRPRQVNEAILSFFAWHEPV